MKDSERERAAWIAGDYRLAHQIAIHCWGDMEAKWQLRLLPALPAPSPQWRLPD